MRIGAGRLQGRLLQPQFHIRLHLGILTRHQLGQVINFRQSENLRHGSPQSQIHDEHHGRQHDQNAANQRTGGHAAFLLSHKKSPKNSSKVQDGADDKAHDERDGDNRTGQRAIAVDELSELVTLTGLVVSCQFSFPFGLVVRPLIGVASYGTVIGILG